MGNEHVYLDGVRRDQMQRMDELKGGWSITALDGDFPIVEHIGVEWGGPLQGHVPEEGNDAPVPYPLARILYRSPVSSGEHHHIAAARLRQVIHESGHLLAICRRADSVNP